MSIRRALGALALVVVPLAAQPARTADYLVYVASEAADRITLLRFGPAGLRVERDFQTGIMPVDIDGPHGLAVAPDRTSFFVSFAHGQPFGSVWKYSTATNEVVGRVTLGMFPATMQVSPSGEFLYIANFNLHGDPVPSSVSVVHTGSMTEIARIPTCGMPHGSRFNPSGARHYSACMMDDALVEIDTATLKVARHFSLAPGGERGGSGPPGASPAHDSMADHRATGSGTGRCSPTWAQPSDTGASIFVACNGRDEIVEIDAAEWTVKRRLPARAGVYNLAVTRDGRLLATNRRDQSVSIVDLKTGRETARIPTPRKVVHGVVVTSDDAYAFVSAEGVSAEPGSVTVIDLAAGAAVASIDVAPQAGGIDVIKVESGKSVFSTFHFPLSTGHGFVVGRGFARTGSFVIQTPLFMSLK
jgi:DNA-binding beta-propeller fold protein YncE